MKIWIGTYRSSSLHVELYARDPTGEGFDVYAAVGNGSMERVHRNFARSLLRGTGLRLPKHGTKQLLEVEIAARKPESGTDKPKRIVTQYLKPRRKK